VSALDHTTSWCPFLRIKVGFKTSAVRLVQSVQVDQEQETRALLPPFSLLKQLISRRSEASKGRHHFIGLRNERDMRLISPKPFQLNGEHC
jgi:hypothetical protein